MVNIDELVAAYGDRPIPLTQSDLVRAPELGELSRKSGSGLFPGARDATSAHAGLLLLLGGWEDAHHVAQDVDNVEGSYWHGILHRIEPDASNANYWFRRVGQHPIFSKLHQAASQTLEQGPISGWVLKPAWDAARFIAWCEEARQEKSASKKTAALAIQQAEWKLLFEFCRETIT